MLNHGLLRRYAPRNDAAALLRRLVSIGLYRRCSCRRFLLSFFIVAAA